MKLKDILSDLASLDQDSTIFARKQPQFSPESEAAVLPNPENYFRDSDLQAPAGMDYFIEVYDARDVLETWSAWRNGRVPDAREAVDAIIYYQENDAYLPTEDMS